MKRFLAFSILAVTVGAMAQPPARGAFVYSDGSWIAAATSAIGNPLTQPPPFIALYCYNGTNWVPADSSCFGGGGSGTVNSGTAGQLGYYAANGTAISGKTGYTSPLIVTASGYGCHLDSDVNSGGGTSDSACIQTGLNALSAAGGGTWVQDGASLIDTTNVNGTTQWSALALPSNVTILCPSKNQGFYLANASDVMMLSNKNITGNPAATFDTNMRVSGCTWNGNGVNQSRFEQGNASNGWVLGVYFAGFNGLTIDNTTFLNSRTFATSVANGKNYTFRDNVCTWNAGGGQSSAPITSGGYNHDCLHMWGPLSNVYAHNIFDHWGDDDGIAINTNEESFAYYANVYWGAARFPWSNATPGVTPPSGANNITDLYVDGFTFDSTLTGVRWIAYTGGNWGTSTGSVSNVTLTNLGGTFPFAPMQNGCSDSQPNCTALTSPGPITVDKWYVTGAQNGLNLPASSSMQLSDIIAGASINTNGATLAQQFPTASGAWTNITNTVTVAGACAVSGSVCITGSPGNSVTFSSIPNSYNHLVLVVTGRTSDSAPSSAPGMQFNSDTGSNYEMEDLNATDVYLGAGATAASSSIPLPGIAGNTATANVAGQMQVFINDYNNTTFFKNVRSNGGRIQAVGTLAQYVIEDTYGMWKSTSAITGITILDRDGGNFVAGTRFTIYGVN